LKHAFLISLIALLGVSGAWAQERIFRCPGNVYTNSASDAKAKNCKPIDGGNVSVVAGTKVKPPASGAAPAASGSAGQKVDSGDQRARDSDARGVLESELKRAEARRVELLAEYKDGQPDKQGIESRNYQRYLDRVEELKAAIARNESDIAGIRRELGRSAPATPGAPSGAK
jgi:hypothetical protein